VFATSKGAYAYDFTSLELGQVFNVGVEIRAVAFEPTRNLYAFGMFNGDIQWQEADTGQYVTSFNQHLLGITDLAMPRQSQYLVSGSDDGAVQVWTPVSLLAPGVTQYVPNYGWRTVDRVTSVDIHQQVQLVAGGSYGEISVWNISTGNRMITIDSLAGWVHDVAFSPGGEFLVVADSSNRVRVWNTVSWVLTHSVQFEAFNQITALGFQPGGTRLLLGGDDGTILLWDLTPNGFFVLDERASHEVTDVVFHPFEDSFVSSYRDGVFRLWSNSP
jgi:COMPASS component SWD3